MVYKVTFFGEEADAMKLNDRLQMIKSVIDNVTTPRLAKIKRVLNFMHFAYIKDQEQLELNQANVVLKRSKNSLFTVYGCEVSYYIENKKTAMVYANFKPKYDEGGELKGYSYTYQNESNYAYFIADLLNEDIIFSKEFDCFLKVDKVQQTFEKIDEAYFKKNYPYTTKQASIKDFLKVFEEVYRNHITTSHTFTLQRYSFYTNDFIYNVETLTKETRKPLKNELFFAYYDVSENEMNIDLINDFERTVAKDEDTLHNLKLVYAYIIRRKIGLEPPEKFFLFNDTGRTGKGLFILTLSSLLTITQLNLDNLLSKNAFDRNNELVRARWCDVVHINESKEITEKDMRILRPIATNEIMIAREIGSDSFSFKPHCTMIIDTNHTPSIGTMKANTSRTVKLAFKERPKRETDLERHDFFEKYWDYMAINEEANPASSLSFLMDSFNYLKEQGNKIQFKDVEFTGENNNEALNYIYNALQDLQENPDDDTPFLLAGDPEIQELLNSCYGLTQDEIARKKSDFENRGIELSYPKFIDGKTTKVHRIKNISMFNSWMYY